MQQGADLGGGGSSPRWRGRQWLSESLGSATIQSDEISQSRGTSSSYSEAQRLLKRELMKPDEIGTMSNDLCILMLRGLPPFRSKKATLDLS